MTNVPDVIDRATPAGLPLMRAKGIALWRQIAGTMEREIAGGHLTPGDRLPTEAELSARFSVNRHTVRRAMEDLEDRGLVRIEQGRGSFVTEDVLDYPIGHRTRFTETIRRQNRESEGRILRVEELPAEADIADQLRIRRGRPVVFSQRLSLVDGRPVVVASHWFSAARFPGIATLLAEEPSITRIVAHFGITDFHREQTRVTARMPSAEEATLLDQPRTRPVIVTEALNIDALGEPVEVSRGCYASGRVQIVAVGR